MASFQERVLGALKLQASTYEEVENDASATGQAATVVVAAAVLKGLALAISTLMIGLGLGIVGLVLGVIFAVIGWVVGSYVVLMVGTKLMPGKDTQADIGQVLRVTGFASAPGLLGILGFIPILNIVLFLILALWTIAAMVVGVKQALDYDDIVKAVIVCVIAWVIMFVVTMIAGLITAGSMGMAGRFM
jgi:hypothetical protein